ncbi:hypothetical protein F2Q70_00043262 [Brassica cretica]|uniref:Uncharacterized protein n=2 Tax=Brassica cretica TaxID=69181 RepID=A0A3N6R3R4_BRACR|nr:hypothetical protein F2Q70_00043262 [Brassica cretica]KAF2605951.1 hypothetical protein F2Q68_00044147 [Brassica cretica]KAF3515506.1 hypothetical protein DY000_02060181 [Brassica cretica]
MHKQELNLRQIVDPIMAKGNEQRGFGELNGVDEADLNREITLEDFLELEDEEQYENLDLNREITMEDILEIENEEQLEILGQDSKLKLDVDRHPTEKDLDTSPKNSINRYPPYIDRHSWLNELPSCMIELEPVEKRMDKSKASHFPVPEHLKSPICAEKAAGFHKRMEKYLTL